MAFIFTDQQKNILKYIQEYSVALKNIQKKYLECLENTALLKGNKDEIWRASFTLQYMHQLHAKYVKLLDELALHSQSQAVLVELLNKLANRLDEPENTFIQDFYEIIESEEFGKKLQNLSSHYNKWRLIMSSIALVGLMGIIGGLCIGFIFDGSITVGLGAGLIILGVLGGIIFSVAGAEALMFRDKRDAIDRVISLWPEAESFKYDDTYDYKTTIDGETHTIFIQKSIPPESTSTLRNRFFEEKFFNNTLSLSDEVKDEYNRLMSIT